jgi:hypothetical protein
MASWSVPYLFRLTRFMSDPTRKYRTLPNAEPVPPASQLVALPFLAAIEGYLRGATPSITLRVTLHRALNREGQIYLQQVCQYLGSGPIDRDLVGRMFGVNFGIMGRAFERRRVLRTRRYPDVASLRSAIAADWASRGHTGDITKERLSWLAVPFLGPDGTPVLVLFADTADQFNFFADDSRALTVVRMCWGFCRLIDSLEEQPFPTIRNYPFEPGENVTEEETAYAVQEELQDVPVPQLETVRSFNYDASAG